MSELLFNLDVALALSAITAGGIISAFTAKTPTRLHMWMSAYLVLVVGMLQFGLISLWHDLGQPSTNITLLAFLLYNIGNAGTIIATVLKNKKRSRSSFLIDLSGISIGISMIVLLYGLRHVSFNWLLSIYILLILIVLVSMPIGIYLSHKRRLTHASHH